MCRWCQGSKIAFCISHCMTIIIPFVSDYYWVCMYITEPPARTRPHVVFDEYVQVQEVVEGLMQGWGAKRHKSQLPIAAEESRTGHNPSQFSESSRIEKGAQSQEVGQTYHNCVSEDIERAHAVTFALSSPAFLWDLCLLRFPFGRFIRLLLLLVAVRNWICKVV